MTGIIPVPAPERSRQMRWSTFLKAYWGAIAGMDFFTVEAVSFRGLNRVVPLNEQHLRELLCDYMSHYHMERNHQGLDNRLIKPSADVISLERPVRRRERLGGMLNYYYREAA